MMYIYKILKSVILGLLLVVSFQASSSASTPHDHNHSKGHSALKQSNALQSVPHIGAMLMMAYHRDTEGLAKFIGISNVRTLSKPRMKAFFNRKRPCGCRGSFPSGHTLLSFQGASFIHYRYGFWYSLPFYGVGAYVGRCRIRCRAHDWIDIAGSAILVNLSTYLFVQPFGQKTRWKPSVEARKDGMVMKIGIRL